MSTDAGIQLGAAAPDFWLRDQFGQDVALSSFRGTKAVAIFFSCSGVGGDVSAHFGDQPGLADPWFTGDEHQAACTVIGRRETFAQRGALELTPDVGGGATKVGHAAQRFPPDAMYLDRIR